MVADPELRFTPGGDAVASFRVASTPRRFDKATGGYVDGDALFLSVNAWRALGENVAETCRKGSRVVVTGVLRQRSYETREGERRTVYEVEANDVAVSLLFAPAKVLDAAAVRGSANSRAARGGAPAGGWDGDVPPWEG